MVEIVLPKGGSTFGLSLAKRQVRCGKAAHLDSLASAAGMPGSVVSEGAMVGTLMHALLEQYELGTLTPGTLHSVSFGPEEHPALAEIGFKEEAIRLMAWWMKHFKPGHFGKTVGVELPLPPDGDVGALVRLRDAFKGLQRTARLDLVVEIDTERSEALRTQFGLDLEPGNYIADYKCIGQRKFDSYLNDPQALYYPLAHNACYPDRPVKGMIFIFLVKTKTPDVSVFLVDYPNETEKKAVQDFLLMESLHREHIGAMPNISACFDYGTCQWLRRGVCDRTSRTVEAL